MNMYIENSVNPENTAQACRLLIRKGRFKHAFRLEKVYLFIWLMVVIAVEAVTYYFSYMAYKDSAEALGDAIAYSNVIFLVVAAAVFAVIISGLHCTYDAGQTEFVITGPGRKKEIFYYSDVQSLSYEPMMLLSRKRGYIVTITTGVRDVIYYYIYSENKVHTEPKDTPFYYLEYNAGLCEEDTEPPADVEAVKEMIEVEKYHRAYSDIKENDDSFFV